MSMAVCMAWFTCGFALGQLVLLCLAAIYGVMKEKKNGKNNNNKSK